MTIPGPMKLAQFRHRSGFGSGNSETPHGGIESGGAESGCVELVDVEFGACMALFLDGNRSDLLRDNLVRIVNREERSLVQVHHGNREFSVQRTKSSYLTSECSLRCKDTPHRPSDDYLKPSRSSMHVLDRDHLSLVRRYRRNGHLWNEGNRFLKVQSKASLPLSV